MEICPAYVVLTPSTISQWGASKSGVVMWSRGFRKCPVQLIPAPNQSWVNYLRRTVLLEHEYTQRTRGFGDETLGPRPARYHSQTVRYCPQSFSFPVRCSLMLSCTVPPLPALPPNMRGFFASLLAVGWQNGGRWREQPIINRLDPFWAELALVLYYWSRGADSVLNSQKASQTERERRSLNLSCQTNNN